MNPVFLDRFSRLNSPIHRLPAAVKTGVGFVVIATVVLCPLRWMYPAAVATAIVVVGFAVSRIPVRFILKRILIVEPFVMAIAALTLFQPDGMNRFLSIIVKSTLSLCTVLLVSNTTPFSALLNVLRRAKVPSIFITVLALMYRYLFVLVDEMRKMERARLSRTFHARTAKRWDVRAGILSQLFLRSTERAERIFAAMTARGWR